MNPIVLTLISPFLGILYSVIYWRLPNAKNAFWLGCCYLGAVMIFWPDGTLLGESSDAGRYYLDLLSASNESSLLGVIYVNTMGDATLDFYKPLMEFIISRFTTNGHILFFAYATVLGFFISRNLWYILEHMTKHDKYFYTIWLLIFFLEVPIWKIGGARMATAFHVFIYGIYPYIIENKKNKIYWCILAVFIHFSFLYITILTIIYVLIPERFKTGNVVATSALVLFIGSMFVKELDFEFARDFVQSISPESYEERIDMYLTEEARERSIESSAQRNFVFKLSVDLVGWLVNILTIAFFFPIRKHLPNKTNMLVYILLIGSVANVMSLASGGGRFLHLFNMLFVAMLLLYIPKIPKSSIAYSLTSISSWALIITIIYGFRAGLDYYSITLFGNFFTMLFIESNVPIMNYIK